MIAGKRSRLCRSRRSDKQGKHCAGRGKGGVSACEFFDLDRGAGQEDDEFGEEGEGDGGGEGAE